MASKQINTIPDESYIDLIQDVAFRPIFILGDHRSGTTLLYKTLVATECFNFVRAYHIIKYDEILYNYVNKIEDRVGHELDKSMNLLGISDRVFDRVLVSSNLPEEYGFILKNAGYESYIDSRNLPLFRELCKKIQFVSHPDKALLLKNPWCLPHFMYVKSAFPEAKFIFIHRHPLHAINSKLKSVRSFLSARNVYMDLIAKWYTDIFDNPVKRFIYRMLYSQYFDLGLHEVTQQAIKSTTYFLQNIESLSNRDYVSIRYEDLCQEPETTILKILDFLELEPRVTLAYENLIEARTMKLLPEVEAKSEQILQKLQPYFAYHGYDI